MKSRSTMVMLVGLAGLYLYYRYTTRTHHAAEPAMPVEIPALQAGDEEALALDAETVRKDKLLRVRLRVKGGPGEVVLVLRDPEAADARGVAFGSAVLEPQDRGAGAALLAAIASWLKQPAPPPGKQNELAPSPVGYVRLGADHGWIAHKLSFERGDRHAELFLNLSSDGRQARLLEKDERAREDLLALLALALRDGPPPRRSPENDPLVATMEPLFHGFQPLAGAENLRAIAGIPGGFLAARDLDRGGKRGTQLLRWTDPLAAPKVVASLDGVVDHLVPDPRGAHAGLDIAFPRDVAALSSDDPHAFALVDLADGTIAKLADIVGFGSEAVAAFSADGGRVAILDGRFTRVYDVATRRALASSPAVLRLAPLRWGPDGLQLIRFVFGKTPDDTRVDNYRWQPGKSAPHLVPAPSLRSPDGRFALDATEEAITITGPEGPRRLPVSRPEDVATFRVLHDVDALHWLGPAELLVDLDEPMALDLPSGKLRYVFPLQGLRFAACSPDGRVLVARNGDEQYVWAQR
jgi:hypothetical protein